LLLAAGGALLGIALANVLSRFLVSYLGGDNPGAIFVSLSTDWRVLGFTAALAVLTCIVFGLMPALKATSAPPARVMSLAGRGNTATRERFSLRRSLVIMQVALSLVLVFTALAFASSLRKILTLNAGFQRDGVLVMDFDYSRLNLPPLQRPVYAESLLDRLRALPGVEGAAETEELPVGGSYWNDRVIVDGKPSEKYVNMSRVSSGYFKTIGTPLLAGRDFDQRDSFNAPRVAIVNQEFARKVLGTENPVGRVYQIDVYKGETVRDYQIVGLVGNTKYQDLREDFTPIAYYPQQQDDKPDPGTEVIVRSSVALEPLLASLRRSVNEMNSALVIDFHPYSTIVKQGLLRERLLATLSGFFGLLAVILATIGLYGVVAYLVVRRTNEIGIRMALGATPARILTMVVRQAATLLAFGIVIGAVLAVAAGKLASSVLVGLKPQPDTLIAAAILLSAVALGASLLPARRAAHLQPTVALREE
jgi:predicted permease